MPAKTYAAIRDDREPRTAAHIAMLVDMTLDATLYELRRLEAEGQIRHTVDAKSVVRWQLVEPEEVRPDLIPLGAMVLHTNRRYDLTPALKAALGL